ncbi:hypothetical protein HDU97_007123 [Phlyctochytrium planicorne]|nr:hypothetical protein HDU97_007123 [Phlyctochytrium planicorne]
MKAMVRSWSSPPSITQTRRFTSLHALRSDALDPFKGFWTLATDQTISHLHSIQPSHLATPSTHPISSIPPKTSKEEQQQPSRIASGLNREDDSLKPPRAPDSEDCCMGGCAHCVWDIYEEEVEAFNAKMKALGKPGISSDRMDPSMQALRDLEKSLKSAR